MPLELNRIEIAVDGNLYECWAYNNDYEYSIESSAVPDISFSSYMKALRLESQRKTGKKRPRIFLELDISESEKSMWDYNILGIWIDVRSSFLNLEFTANSSIGAQVEEISEIVKARLQGTDFSLHKVRPGDVERPVFDEDGWRSWTVDIRMPLKSETTFTQLLRMRADVCQEVFLPRSELTSAYMILRAVQFGRFDTLVGASESEILDVKSVAYDLKRVDEAHWKLELAQDVAQFANAHGGLLVIGYRTKKKNGIDVIDKITPVQPRPTRLQSYADIVKSRIHPPISGLQLGDVPVGENQIIYFYIPPQPEENKPYLVTGAMLDGAYAAAGISIVRRQGDGCTHVSAQEIHEAYSKLLVKMIKQICDLRRRAARSTPAEGFE
jgi:hypothetical protein